MRTAKWLAIVGLGFPWTVAHVYGAMTDWRETLTVLCWESVVVGVCSLVAWLELD